MSWKPASPPPEPTPEPEVDEVMAEAAAAIVVPVNVADLVAPPVRRPAPQRHMVVVGVDFGTSGTKVVFRDGLEKGRPPRVVDWATDLPGFSRFSFPSTVALAGDQILVGSEAEGSAAPDAILRSVKMLLLAGARDGTAFAAALRARGGAASRVHDPHALAAAVLLAEVVRQTVNLAMREFRGLDVEQEISFNLDVPVDHSTPSEEWHRFRRTLDVAVEMAMELGAERRTQVLAEAWIEIEQRVRLHPVPESERRRHVVPEALAVLEGVRGFASPVWGRNYAVVDIGAGTTDVGIFRVVSADWSETVPFFAARSLPTGGDHLDRWISDALVPSGSSDAELVARVRAAKKSLAGGRRTVVRHDGLSHTLEPRLLRDAVEAVGGALLGHYASTFGQAYAKEPNQRYWPELHTMVVGGGSLIEPLRAGFSQLSHAQKFCKVHLAHVSELVESTPTLVVGASSSAPGTADLPFLVAAMGLSYPEPLMRGYKRPEEVPVTREIPARESTYAYEAELY
jgi:hypothetical protein